MSKPLDPCPFCDGEDLVVDEISPRVWAVCCNTCKAVGPESEAGIEQAQELWCRDPAFANTEETIG